MVRLLVSLWIIGLVSRLIDCPDPTFSTWVQRAQSIWFKLTTTSQTAVIDQTMACGVNGVVHLILLVHDHICDG